MPQLRKHYFLEKYVIIATDRAKRPIDFKKDNKKLSPKENCPFCPENEHMIPRVIEESKDNDYSMWNIRAIENKFKAVGADYSFLRTDNEFYTFGNAYGDHEVIIETPIHGLEFEDLNDNRIENTLKLIQRRLKEGYKKNGVEYVSCFKNRGDDAAASLSHSHHQIISYNLFPTEIKEEVVAIKDYKSKNGGVCPVCKVILSEKDSDRRIYQDDKFVVFSPYASRFCFEAWIMPRRCVYSITELSNDEISVLAKLLKKTLTTLNKMNYPAYNLFYKMSNDKNKDYHFRIEIAPRLSKWAGFEFVTGTIINSVTPESAAKFYRNEE